MAERSARAAAIASGCVPVALVRQIRDHGDLAALFLRARSSVRSIIVCGCLADSPNRRMNTRDLSRGD